MTSQRLETESGAARRLLAAVVGFVLALLGLVLASGPAAAQERVGAQPVQTILAVDPHGTAGQESVGVRGPPLRPIASATGVAAEAASPSFAVASNGEALALGRVSIPGPVNAAQGKIDFLLARVAGAKSESRGAFFGNQMGFDDASLEAALRRHLVDNFAEFPAGPAQFEGELGRLQITAPTTGPSGMTSKVTSIWGLLPDGATSLITAW